MNRIRLKTGVLIIPDEAIIADTTMTENVDYAGIVIDRDGQVPWLIILSESPLIKLSFEDEDALVLGAISDMPDYKVIRSEEADRVFEDGIWINQLDWNETFRLRFHMVPEVEDEEHLIHGVGIVRD